jgi:hypothetical protein
MLNWSFIDPGCITAVMPVLPIEHNLKGKKASLAIDAPFKSNPKFFAFSCTSASTRDVCPVPDEINVCFFAKTIVFDLVFLQTFEANIKSSISCSEGLVVVTVLNRLYCLYIVSFLN